MEGTGEHSFQTVNAPLVALPMPVRPMPQMQAQNPLVAPLTHGSLPLGNNDTANMHVGQMPLGPAGPIENENGEPDNQEGGQGRQMQPQGLHRNTLTLHYQNELYLFEGVPPEKVQAVLLLLGNRDSNINNLALAQPANAVLGKGLVACALSWTYAIAVGCCIAASLVLTGSLECAGKQRQVFQALSQF